jgi:hypothetical protein
MDSQYYIKEDYLFYYDKTYKLGGWIQFDIKGIDEGKTFIRVQANWIGMPFVPGRLIDFFIHYKLTQKGVSVIHASGISWGEEGILFSGRGGGGKTFIALHAVLDEQFKFLGDNFILVKNDRIFSFPSDLNLFDYNLHPKIWKCMTDKEKAIFISRSLLYKLSNRHIKIFTPISPVMVFPDSIESNAHLNTFYSLLSGREFDLRRIDHGLILDRTVSNQKLEFFEFTRHIKQYATLFPKADFARHWEIYRETLAMNLSAAIDYFEITLPRKLRSNDIGDVLKNAHHKNSTLLDTFIVC